MSWEFELLAGPYGGTTEGPAWDGESLFFTHIPASLLLRYDPGSGKVTEHITNTLRTNGLAFDAQGNLYGCQTDSRRIVRFELDGAITNLPNELEGRRHNKPNDLAIDLQGHIWFTDQIPRGPMEDPLDHASVLRLDPNADGSWDLQRMTFDTTSPNGILVSPDQRTLYVAQSDYDGVRELRAYPINYDGTLGPYLVLHQFGQDFRGVHRGVDGMCFDTEGNIIACAGWTPTGPQPGSMGWPQSGPGPLIYVFAPSGRVLETHPTPQGAHRPTNCTFGGPDLDILYITTGEGHLFSVANTGRRGWLLYPPTP